MAKAIIDQLYRGSVSSGEIEVASAIHRLESVNARSCLKTKEKNMKQKASRPGLGSRSFHCLMAVLSVALLSPTYSVALAQETAPQPALPGEQAPKIPNDQLDSLVAPIALYPDPLLSQTLVASTYPLEIVQLQQWLGNNREFKGQGAGRCSGKTALGPQHPVHGDSARRGQAVGR